jgi:prepilin-type N-terminal cleavage/methylation domain-containing protein
MILMRKKVLALGTRKLAADRRPSGFTLLEVLLALGLSVVLLAAVAAAIDLYRRMTFSGQEELSEGRLVRAVLQKIERDIRSIVPPQAKITTPADTPSTSPTPTPIPNNSNTPGTQSTVTDPLQNVNSQTVFGLYGDQRSLVINTLCAHPLAPTLSDPAAVQPLSAIHGDLKTVAYFIVGVAGSVTPIPQASGQSTPGAMTSGLARLEGDHLAIGYAMQQSAMLASTARVIAPEVTMISFRYFDGTQWLMSWDAAFMQTLPQAVEITIAVRASDATASGTALNSTALNSIATNSAAAAQLRQYRHVVAISTAAAPITINELLTIPTGTTP